MKNKVFHWVAAVIFFGVPFIVSHSAVDTITVGAILHGLYLWASQYVNPTAPISSN